MHDLRHWIDLCETQETGGADEFDVIAYHGSNQDFDSFDEATIRPNRWGPHGFCFVQDPRAAAFYGDIVYKVELRIQNPKIVQNVEDFHSFKNRERQLQMSGVDAVAGPNELGQFEIVVFDPANIRILNKIGTVKEASGTVGAGQRIPLDFDKLYGRAFKITDPEGDPSRQGFSIISRIANGSVWDEWRERPQFKWIVKQRLNDPSFLGDYKYQQIVDSAQQLGLLTEA